MLKAVTDTRSAQWVVDGLDRSPNLSGLIPAVFSSYARILHKGAKLEEDNDLELGALPETVSVPLKEILTGYTGPSEECWFGIWSGWAFDYKPSIPQTLTVHTGYREWFLFTGSLDALGFKFFLGENLTANVVWPSGRAWFLANEIEFDCTYIGGSSALITSLLKSDELEVEVTRPTENIC